MNNIKCSHICVDCVANDPVDIRCGGPQYLGFDFYVREEETNQMKKFITVTLKTFDIPLINIYVKEIKNVNEQNVWTKERIVAEIKKEEDYLKSEASRNYYRSLFRR